MAEWLLQQLPTTTANFLMRSATSGMDAKT